MGTEELGVYAMVAGSAVMLALMIRILGISRAWSGALVLVVLTAFALGLKGLGGITSTRRH